jgi:cysteine desulfurase
MNNPVYMDYAATTPVDPRVAEKMAECLTMDGVFGNPASKSHYYGWMAAELVDIARSQIAELIGADHREIIFTSGATESDNTAIKGAALALSDRGNHIITSSIEHKAVLDTCRFLETRGFQVTYLKPGRSGTVTPAQVEEAITDKTVLVSLMHVNNELGTVNDISGVSEVCRSRGILLHSDAAQSLGKEKISVSELGADMLSLSAHKIYGPKGIGALYIRKSPDVKPVPLMHGGGHERGFRSGTLPTHQIAGMGEACRILSECFEEETSRIRGLRDELQRKLMTLPGVRFNGSADHRVCGILNLSFGGVEGEMLLSSLRDVAVSSGSACTSASVEPSYVLTQIGVPRELAYSSVRFSLGRFTRSEDIDFVFRAVTRVLAALR